MSLNFLNRFLPMLGFTPALLAGGRAVQDLKPPRRKRMKRSGSTGLFRFRQPERGRWSCAELRALRAKNGVGPVRKIRKIS